MRFLSNGGFATATRVELTPIGGDEFYWWRWIRW
jgi:hypothetical protein